VRRSNGKLVGLGAGGVLLAAALFIMTRGPDTASVSVVPSESVDGAGSGVSSGESEVVAGSDPADVDGQTGIDRSGAAGLAPVKADTTPKNGSSAEKRPTVTTRTGDRESTNSSTLPVPADKPKDPVGAGSTSGTRGQSEPPSTPPVASPEAGTTTDKAGTESAPAPVVVVAGPSEEDARALAFQYTARLKAGEFRAGELASFFSRTTTAHNASVAGGPRVVSKQGETMVIDVDVALERTLGSGAIYRRASTVRLVLRGRPGTAVIESATAGPLQNPR
jgi:hypothetical protein